MPPKTTASTPMWKRFELHAFGSPHSDAYRRAYLLNSILIVIASIFLTFTLANILFTQMIGLIVVDGLGFLLTLGLITYFHHSKKLERSSTLTIISFALLTIAYTSVTQHHFHAFYWLIIFPTIAILLKGTRSGLIYSGIYYTYFFSFIISQTAHWQPDPFTWMSTVNIAGATLSLLALIVYSEYSRHKTQLALEAKNKQLEKLSITDQLTGLNNRIKLDTSLEQQLALAKRYQSSYAIILIDLDQFKQVNDKFGHLLGDQVLMALSKLLSSLIRETDILGRWGGEEFMIICPETTAAESLVLAEKIRLAVVTHDFPIPVPQTISIGISEYYEGAESKDIIRQADDALYLAKHLGRNQTQISTHESL